MSTCNKTEQVFVVRPEVYPWLICMGIDRADRSTYRTKYKVYAAVGIAATTLFLDRVSAAPLKCKCELVSSAERRTPNAAPAFGSSLLNVRRRVTYYVDVSTYVRK